MAKVVLDGESLLPSDIDIIKKFDTVVELTPEAWKKIEESREVIHDIVRNKQTVYGVNTGLGTELCSKVIPDDKIDELNLNTIRSHACGVGESMSHELTRCLMAFQLNGFAMGYKAVSRGTVVKQLAALNANCLPVVPMKGTVGCHDLAQLAHLALGLIGEGQMWSPRTGLAPADQVLAENGLEKIVLKHGEAIGMINGTNYSAVLSAEALNTAKRVVESADVIAAMTIEGLVGTPAAFDADIHNARPHSGQIKVARKVRSLLGNKHQKSEITDSWPVSRVQDPYTLRCIPQVHGISHDIVKFCDKIITDEICSSNANPMMLDKTMMNNGNFHGEYLAKAADYLCLAVHELGNMSERRIERLCNPACSELESFLAVDSGLNTGFMMAHVTASALVSESKTLCHPGSVDSIPTAANYEDHVSMSGWSGRKLLQLIDNVALVLAIELLAACQAVDLRRPLKSTPILEEIHAHVRKTSAFVKSDRVLAEEIKNVAGQIKRGEIWSIVSNHIDQYED